MQHYQYGNIFILNNIIIIFILLPLCTHQISNLPSLAIPHFFPLFFVLYIIIYIHVWWYIYISSYIYTRTFPHLKSQPTLSPPLLSQVHLWIRSNRSIAHNSRSFFPSWKCRYRNKAQNEEGNAQKGEGMEKKIWKERNGNWNPREQWGMNE